MRKPINLIVVRGDHSIVTEIRCHSGRLILSTERCFTILEAGEVAYVIGTEGFRAEAACPDVAIFQHREVVWKDAVT